MVGDLGNGDVGDVAMVACLLNEGIRYCLVTQRFSRFFYIEENSVQPSARCKVDI